jgi:hypothetical protein
MTKARAAADEVLNPDDWRTGLGFGMKSLNTKSVRRARRPSEVLLVCCEHNARKGNKNHRHRRPIDPTRTVLNTVLRGSSEPSECASTALSIFDELGIDLNGPGVRVDAIVGIEYVFQPQPGWDVSIFYESCLAWIDGRFHHVISAIVHRDQIRPHMHVLVLAVLHGKLAGAALTSQENRLEAQRSDFMAYMRVTLGVRPDREAKSPATSTALTKLAISAGKGPKTRAAAANSDAALELRTGAGLTNLIAHQPHSPTARASHLIAPTSYCARLSAIKSLFAEGVSAGLFPSTPLRPVTPAPRPLPPATPAPKRDKSREWVLPASVAAPPTASPQQVAPTDAPGATTVRRPFRIPPGLLGATPVLAEP